MRTTTGAAIWVLTLAVVAAPATEAQEKKPPPKPSGHTPLLFQALVDNESRKIPISITGAGEVHALDISGLPPRTQAGQATGKRQHMPIRMRMYYDQAAGPAKLKAALKPGGTVAKLTTPDATLEDGRIESVRMVPKPDSSKFDRHEIVEVEFVFQKISWR